MPGSHASILSLLLVVVAACAAGVMSLLSRHALSAVRRSGSPDRRIRALRTAVGWDAGALAALVAGGVAYGCMAV